MHLEVLKLPEKCPLEGQSKASFLPSLPLSQESTEKASDWKGIMAPALGQSANMEGLPRIVLAFLGTLQGGRGDTALPLCLVK